MRLSGLRERKSALRWEKRLPMQSAETCKMGSLRPSNESQHHVIRCLVNVWLAMSEGVVDRRIHHGNTKLTRHPRIAPAWNKVRIVGQKRPLKPKRVWAIRVRLELAENHRDLALFNLAIDSKRRGCDLVKMKVVDVMASGQIKERASALQSKTQKPVRFELSESTRTSLARWMREPLMVRSEYLWPGAFTDGFAAVPERS